MDRILSTEPKRGDVVVFKTPYRGADFSNRFITRLPLN